jgi:hypothetical protein
LLRGGSMDDKPKDGLFLKIGPVQAAAYGPLGVLMLGVLGVLFLAGRAFGRW